MIKKQENHLGGTQESKDAVVGLSPKEEFAEHCRQQLDSFGLFINPEFMEQIVEDMEPEIPGGRSFFSVGHFVECAGEHSKFYDERHVYGAVWKQHGQTIVEFTVGMDVSDTPDLPQSRYDYVKIRTSYDEKGNVQAVFYNTNEPYPNADDASMGYSFPVLDGAKGSFEKPRIVKAHYEKGYQLDKATRDEVTDALSATPKFHQMMMTLEVTARRMAEKMNGEGPSQAPQENGPEQNDATTIMMINGLHSKQLG